jgi:hypothetical protein
MQGLLQQPVRPAGSERASAMRALWLVSESNKVSYQVIKYHTDETRH